MDVAFSEDLSKGAGLGEEKAIPGKVATTYQTPTGKETAKMAPRRKGVHNYRGGRNGKELAKMSVRQQRNDRRYLSIAPKTSSPACLK
jgi:hypothetical protein